MAYRLPAASETDPGAPLTSELMKALAGNPEGVANGDAGAPRIKDAALDAGAATPAGTDWVAKRMAGVSAGDVGVLVMAVYIATGSGKSFGGIADGADLEPSNAAGNVGAGALPAGTSWQCLGLATANGSSGGAYDPGAAQTTLWLRVS